MPVPGRLDGAFGLDAATLAALAAAIVILAAAGLVAVVLRRLRYGPRARLRQRALRLGGAAVAAQAPPGRVSGDGRPLRRQVQAKLAEIEAQKRRPRRLALRRLLREAGLEVTPRRFLLLSALFGAACAGVVLSAGIGPLAAALVGGAMGLGPPRWFVRRLARRRRAAFTRHFAGALDVIVRGIQSGLPVEECFNAIARESPDPVGGEFRLLVEQQRLGLTLDEALSRAHERMPTAELKFFATVLSIQKQTGGNLAETLANLSGVLRDRHRMAAKVRALSSEARASALIIGALPVFVAALLYLVNESYISLMFRDPIGHFLIAGGVLVMTLGTIIMKKMVSFDI
jgi:tight adherence protein B